MRQKIHVIKENGHRALFDPTKLENSLQRSGASAGVIRQVMSEVRDKLYDGMSTSEIYKMAFSLLAKTSRPTAARYKLKSAILELGPTGFPFERFVARVLAFEGYSTQVGVEVMGRCVQHEIDVIVEKNGKRSMVECKFHSDSKRHCDVKVPLYIHSRFKDVEREPGSNNGEIRFQEAWIVTNTRFTTDAVMYGDCVGMNLISWNFPERKSLKDRIDASGLHPITCLGTLTQQEKQNLLMKDIVLSREVRDNPEVLEQLGLSENRKKNILAEVHGLSH